MITDLANTTQHHVARARQQIAAILGAEIKLLPHEAGYLEAELVGDYGGLMRAAAIDSKGKK